MDASPTVHLMAEGFAKHTGGVQRSSFELLRSLRRLGTDVHVASWVERGPPRPGRAPRPARRLWLQATEAVGAIRPPAQVSHALYYDPAVAAARGPLAVTVHDMVHEREGGGSAWMRVLKRQAVRRADVVVVHAAVTADDLRAEVPDVGPIVVSHLGVSSAFLAPATSASARAHLLYVGRRGGYKNFDLLAAALATDAELLDVPLVVVGGLPLAAGERSRLGRVEHVSGADDDELRSLYDSALALVVPSRREGFGLPVLEAMARGCPVACSDRGSLVEVAGGHATLFDAGSVEGCAAAIRTAVDAPAAQLAAASDHARRFTWRAAAERHRRVYAELATR